MEQPIIESQKLPETPKEDIKKQIEDSKKNSLKDAAFVNGTVGFGDNYISSYQADKLALNASASEVGLLTSIPNLIAPLAQLVTSKLMEKHSRKKIFSIATLIQSLAWLPIISISFFFLKGIEYAPLLLITFYTVYALFGNLASPAWVSWIGDVVENKGSGEFFGKRNKIGGIAALISLILAGLILDVFKSRTEITRQTYFIFIGFAIIFSLAMIFRLISRHFVLKQYEPHFRFERENYFSFFQFVKKIPERTFGRFSLYIALVVLATNIAGPYYGLYMLNNLKLSYTQIMILSVYSSLATFIFISKWGKFSDKHGNIHTIRISAMMIPLICFIWPAAVYLVPKNYQFYSLIIANFISGYAWAGFNLAAGNFVFESSTPQRRGLCSAYSSVLNGVGVILGTTIGSILIAHVKLPFIDVIMFVSLVSGIARYLVSIIMLKSIKEVREVEKPHLKMVPMASDIYNLQTFVRKGLLFRIRKNKKEEVVSVVPKIQE
jgi:MFS family permease